MEYTEEQEYFIMDFGNPMISFSLPGTGKTATAVAALLALEHYDKVPGDQIYALSFTINATAEIKVRHETALQKAGKGRQKVHFRTLSAICKDILEKYHYLIGMPGFQIIPTPPIESSIENIESICEDFGTSLKPYQGRKVLDALNYSNSSFVFDRSNLTARYPFVKADIDYDLFMRNRSQLYEASRSMGRVPVGDVVLYTLELLLTHPEIAKIYQDKCKVMLIDEFQDMSLLQLKVASKICQNLIVIGDINQQIYAFNGACQEIVDEYRRMYPNAVERNLTQSFRCSPEIAEYSRAIIAPNKTGGENIKGFEKRRGGVVTVENTNNVTQVISEIEKSYFSLNYFEKSYLFLARNNYSLIPIANRLYERKVPFRLSGYKPLYQWTIVRDLVAMIDLLRRPTDHDGLYILSKFIPEFKRYKISEQNPLFKIMQARPMSFLSINFEYDDYDIVQDIYSVFFDVSKMLNDGAPCFPMFMALYDIYYETHLKFYADKLDTPPESVLAALEECCGDKAFQNFIAFENDKEAFIKENNRRRQGILCTTLHGSKGLEADIVHIFDADRGIVPSKKNMTAMVYAGCDFDVAREIRNERSLVYVAVTRAKERLHIHYNGELSPIFVGSNAYDKWDALYAVNKPIYSDVDVFLKFIGGEWCD